MGMKRLAVLGYPISHSKSPVIMLAALGELGVDATFDVVELAEGLSEWMTSDANNYDCLSVTIPLKPEANDFAETLDNASRATGSTNCLIKTSTGYAGFNTDGFGLKQAVSDLDYRSVSVLGTGATARTALHAFSDADLKVWGRDRAKAETIADRFGAMATDFEDAISADLVVSTLPIGVLPKLLEKRSGRALLDIAYMNESNSEFQVKISGLEMLIWQAIGQLRHLLNQSKPFSDEQDLHDLMLRAVKMEE